MFANILVQVYAIDQMIEELLGHLGPEKTAERSQAIAERKEEEATFLATATPKEKGRMSHLLKMKSKIGVTRKQRVVYDVFDFQKRIRPASQNSQSLINSSTQPQTQDLINSTSTTQKKKIAPTVLERYDDPMNNK